MSVGLMGIAAAYMLYVVLLPIPALKVFAAAEPVEPVGGHMSTQPTSGVPTRIVIKSLGIDKSIKTGSYDSVNRVWTLSDTGVFFADASVPANDSNGTTLLYGHAQWGVFGVLPDITNGAEAVVYTDSGHTFTYRYNSVRQTVASDVSVFTNAGSPKLVLQTCTGVWDDYRSLYSFDLVGVAKL